MNADRAPDSELLHRLSAEVRHAAESGQVMALMLLIGSGTELLGAALDSRPLKAKGQGRKRFELALRKLFPAEYTQAMHCTDLYGQLRSHFAHSLSTGNHLIVSDDKPHLSMEEGKLCISPMRLAEDFIAAIQRLTRQG